MKSAHSDIVTINKNDENEVSRKGCCSCIPKVEEREVKTRVITIAFFASLLLIILIQWYFYSRADASHCATGVGLPGDVTWPEPPSSLTKFAVIWSFIPYAVAFVASVCAVYYQTATMLMFMLLMSIVVFVNELIVKRIPGIAEPRPSGSCLHTNGMPSSHAMLSVALWLWGSLETLMWPKFPTLKRLFVFVFWSVLLLPVPYSRTVTQDHSPSQVGAGSAIGCLVAVVFYFVLNRYMPRIMNFLNTAWVCKCMSFKPDYVCNHECWISPKSQELIQSGVLDRTYYNSNRNSNAEENQLTEVWESFEIPSHLLSVLISIRMPVIDSLKCSRNFLSINAHCSCLN